MTAKQELKICKMVILKMAAMLNELPAKIFNDWENIHIDDLPFTNATKGRLAQNEIYTLGELIKYNRHSLLRCRNISYGTVAEIEKVLAMYNLRLGSTLPKKPIQLRLI